MSHPLVSVIIRTSANRKGCLSEAIDSVLEQTYQNIELVIVENGSHELEAFLKKHESISESKKISYYHSTVFDRCIAGNLGLTQARGEYLCFLDDDDIFYPEHLGLLVTALETNRAVVAAYSLADELPCEITSHDPFEYKAGKKSLSFQREFSRGALFVNNNIAIQCILFRKSLFQKYGGFDPELERLEDWHLWVKYASKDDFIFINETTSMYRTPYSINEISSRDKMLDIFYPMAREKQKDISIKLDQKLLTEILVEIFRPTKIACLIYSKISKRMVLGSAVYKEYCEQNELDPKTETYRSNVLEAINLANEIVMENKLLWFMQRMEHTIKKLFHLSLFKRIWLRS